MKYKPSEKLILDETIEQKYLLNYRDLKFYIKHGMNSTKRHTVYQLRQSPLLVNYIKYNADERAKAKPKFENFRYKLKINGFYGKVIKNVRKRINVHLIHKTEINKKQLFDHQKKQRKNWRICEIYN